MLTEDKVSKQIIFAKAVDVEVVGERGLVGWASNGEDSQDLNEKQTRKRVLKIRRQRVKDVLSGVSQSLETFASNTSHEFMSGAFCHSRQADMKKKTKELVW